MALELKGVKKLNDKVKGFFSQPKPEEELLHNDLVKITTQLRMTGDLVTHNIDLFSELAEGDDEVKDLLRQIADKERKGIEDKILQRESITTHEATKLVDSLNTITEKLSGIGVSLEVNIGDLVGNFKGALDDSRIGIEQRREMLTDISAYLEKQGVESKAFEELKDINVESMNFTKNEQEHLGHILDRLTVDTTDMKTQATLKEINNSLDSSVLTQEELKSVMEKRTESGESTFEEMFKKFPAKFSQGMSGDMAMGAIDAFVPGLGSLLSGTGLTEKIASSGMSFGKKLLSKAKGMKPLSFGRPDSADYKGATELTRIEDSLDSITDFKVNEGPHEKERNQSIEKLDDTLKNISTKELREDKKGTAKLESMQASMTALTDIEGEQSELLEEGFEDLSDDIKKGRRRGGILPGGRGGGGLETALGAGLGVTLARKMKGLFGKGGSLIPGTGKAAVKGVGTLSRLATSFFSSPVGLATASGVGGYLAGSAIDKYLLGDIEEEFFDKRAKKKIEGLYGDSVTSQDIEKIILENHGEERLKEYREKVSKSKQVVKNKSQSAKIKESIETLSDMKQIEDALNLSDSELVRQDEKEVKTSIGPSNVNSLPDIDETQDILKRTTAKIDAMPVGFDSANDAYELEIKRARSERLAQEQRSLSGTEAVSSTAKNAVPPVNMQTPSGGSGVDRRPFIDDFGLAFINSIVFE